MSATVTYVPLEPVLDAGARGRWQYCSERRGGEVITQLYLHVDCDVITERATGNCAACGAPSPSSPDWDRR